MHRSWTEIASVRARRCVWSTGLASALLFGAPAPGAAQLQFGPPAPLNTNAGIDSGGSDGSPQVTTDGAGNWVAVWHSTNSLEGTIDADLDILVARSTDDGETWTPPTPLDPNAETDSGADVDPQVTTDGGGNWVAVWASNDSRGGTIGTDSDILVARSTDNGTTWTSPKPLDPNAGADSRASDEVPQLTTDGQGNWVAVWQSNRSFGGIGTDRDLLVARSTDNGASWTSPVPLNTNAGSDRGDDFDPQVATDGVGNWVAVWTSQDSLGGTIGPEEDILVARSIDNGASWTTPAPLNSNAGSDSENEEPQVATDGDGNWVAVWSSGEILVSRSTDNGASWTPAAQLDPDARAGSELPQVTTDGTGNWVVAWIFDNPRFFRREVVVARSADNGASWTSAAALDIAGCGDNANAQVTTDRAGNWVAVWSSESSDLIGETIGFDEDILVARSTNNGASWTSAASLNTNAESDFGFDESPQVATDGAGNWVAVWASDDPLDDTIGTDFDILVARSTDNGASWTPPSLLDPNAGNDSVDEFDPQVTTDGDGNWVAVWTLDASCGGSDQDLLVARSTNNGASWTPPAPLNTNADSDFGFDFDPKLTTDRAGNWVAVWMSTDRLNVTLAGFLNLLVARSMDNGASWTPPAPLNTNAGTDSANDGDAEIATDGAGNWVAVWSSVSSLGGTIGFDSDILVARSTDGGASWSPPNALNSNAGSDSGEDFEPVVTTDGAGNWVAVWGFKDSGDTIGTDEEILVARSTDNGASWTPPASLDPNARNDSGCDFEAQVTTDGAGNWVAVWASDRSLGGTIGFDEDILMALSTDSGASWTPPQPLHLDAGNDSGDDFEPQLTTDGAGNWVAVWISNDSLGGTIGNDEDIVVSLATGPACVDTDGDTLCDTEDPCKHFANTLPLVISGFSGIPDECLCGDFDGDGFHSATDAAAVNDCAAFLQMDCVSERDEVAPPIDGFYSATDADLINRVSSFLDPAYALKCGRRPEGTCGGQTGVSCDF